MNTAAKARFIIPALGLLALGFWLLFQYKSPVVHYNNMAHIFMLNTLEIWDEESPAAYHFAPVQTWPGAEKHNHYYKRLEDAEGNNYYVSYPALAFIANYAVLKTFHLPINQTSLQWILIFMFLIEAIMLAWIASRLSQQSNTRNRHLTILVAIAIYLLNPVNLYAHSQYNICEIWGQFFLITTLTAWMYYLQSDRVLIARLLLFLSAALLAATDWMGLILIPVMFMVYFKQLKKPHIRYGIIVLTISVILASIAMFLQYASINGINAFLRALGIRFLERSGYFGSEFTDQGYDVLNPETWHLVLQQIQNVLSGPGYIVIGMMLICLFYARKKCTTFDFSYLKIALLPPFLFFIAFISVSCIHYIYTAKFTPFIALAGAALFAKLLEIFKKPGFFIAIFIFLMHLAAFWSTNIFHNTIPTPDKKLTQLNAAAKLIHEEKRNKIELQPGWVESDIIYLSYKSKRNLVWER